MTAREWAHAAQAAVCDGVEPWAHGTVLRATRYPLYFQYNSVRVEEDPEMSAAELAAFADEALAGLEHRRLEIEPLDVAGPLRAEFEAMGWLGERLVFMRHEAPAPPAGPRADVTEVPWDAVRSLRVAWHHEDFPQVDLGTHLDEAREVALMRSARVLAVHEEDRPVAFAQIEWQDRAAEITQVFVHPDHRGRGLGTAVTRAAIDAAGEVDDLWIVADDEGRPKHLYARLGFRPEWRSVHVLRLP